MESRSSQGTLAGVFDAAAERTARDLAEPEPSPVDVATRRAGPEVTPRSPIACEAWTPIRYVRAPQRCEFCGAVILAASPGSSTGDRGTRAFWQPRRNRWQCLGCHSELVRIEVARERCAASSCPTAGGAWAGCAGFCRDAATSPARPSSLTA